MRPLRPAGPATPRSARGAADTRVAIVGVPLLEVELGCLPEPSWLRELTQRWSVRPRVDLCRVSPGPNRTLLQLVELVGRPSELDEVESFVLRDAGLAEVSVVRLAPTRRLVRCVTPAPATCGRLLEAGAICTACRFERAADGAADGPGPWRLLLPRGRSSRELLAGLSQVGGGGRVGSVRRATAFHPEPTLTPRQAEAIETAYRLGFYAFPRRTDLAGVARQLKVSRSATAELLRRAEEKLLGPVLASAALSPTER